MNYEDKIRDMDQAGIDQLFLIAPVAELFHVDPDRKESRFMQKLYGKKLLFSQVKKFMDTFEGDGVKVLGKVEQIYNDPENARVFAFAEAHPDRFKAWVTLNPGIMSDEETEKECRQYAQSPAFVGIKLHPFYHRYKLDKLEKIMQLAEELQCPVLFHLDFEDRKVILDMADRHPKVNMILAHCCFPFFDIIWKDLKKRSNLYVDISASGYVTPEMAARAFKVLGPEKCIYGSDGPFGPANEYGRFDMGFQLKCIPDLDANSREAVLSGNIRKLIEK